MSTTVKVSSKTKNCPECNTSWVAGTIPKQSREYYSPPYFFSRLIGISDSKLDRVVEYVCPDCKARFPRL